MKYVADAINSGTNFIVATHVNPDGDALGSAIALSMALESLGKKVLVFDRDGVPATYDFIPGAERVKTDISGFNAETLILVDCNSLKRAGLEGFSGCQRTIVIDHHETEGNFGDIRWVETEVPATGMMVLKLINSLGVELTKDMAQNLYTAIALDTGTFRYGNTTPESLRAGAELTEAGAEPGFIADRLYNNWSSNRFALFHKIMETMDINTHVSFMKVSLDMLSSTSSTQADTENFVNHPLVMDDIKVAVLLRQVDKDTWKASMRSKGSINVAAIAEKFGGGGHKNAAGCTISGEYDSIRASILKQLKALK